MKFKGFIAIVMAVAVMVSFGTTFGPWTVNVSNETTGVEWVWTLPNVTGVIATVTLAGDVSIKPGSGATNYIALITADESTTSLCAAASYTYMTTGGTASVYYNMKNQLLLDDRDRISMKCTNSANNIVSVYLATED